MAVAWGVVKAGGVAVAARVLVRVAFGGAEGGGISGA